MTAALTPAANAAGWNNSDVTVTWTATDAGSGVAAAQPFQTDSRHGERHRHHDGAGTDRPPRQHRRRRLGDGPPRQGQADDHRGAGRRTPTARRPSRSPATDSGARASGIASCLADGRPPTPDGRSRAVTVDGTATDNAGNTATASVDGPGRRHHRPDAVRCADHAAERQRLVQGRRHDPLDGGRPRVRHPDAPADTTITGEGTGLTSTHDGDERCRALHHRHQRPAVKIDRTAPTTGISGTSNNWINGNVTVALAATDNLSTVDTTKYTRRRRRRADRDELHPLDRGRPHDHLLQHRQGRQRRGARRPRT